MSPSTRAVGRVALAVGAGITTGLAFEPLAWAWLLLPGVAGVTIAVRGVRPRAAFGLGLLFGLAFMAVLIPWVKVIGVDAWIGLSLLEALFYGLLGLMLARVQTLPGWPCWTAACWVVVEVLRSAVPWGGFPWGRLAFGTIDSPLAPAIAWVGTAGTTYLVALLGAGLAWLVLTGASAPRRSILVAVGGVALLLLPGLLPTPGEPDPDAPTARVALVQGDVPGEGMEAFAERRAVLNNHVAATLGLAKRIAAGDTPQPDFVLWPENSTDIDPFVDRTVYDDISGAVSAVGVPTLVGAMVAGPGPIDVKNQGIVWDPLGGPGEAYSKTHPVPFGEYIPLRAQLAKVFKRLDQIPRDMVPGSRSGLLDLAGVEVGDVICFEVAYDDVFHDVVDQGAKLLVVQTNNATYMGTSQVDQQFAMARLRALETGRYVAVAATNGVSGIIAPNGSVVKRAPVRTQTVLEDDIPLLHGLTPAMRFGAALQWALVAVGLGAFALALLRDRRSRVAVAAPQPSITEPPVASELR